MRMAGPDIVLFVVGALLFGGATYAIVSQDGGLGGQTSALGVFNVRFQPQTVEVDSQQVASLRSASAEFDVNASRVLTVIVTVACNDPAPAAVAPFQVQVRVEGPAGLTGEGSGACGQGVAVEIEVGDAPADTSVAGTTETEARENLPAEPSAANGAWTVTVSGSRGQQPPVGLPAVDPAGTITLSIEVAEPQFSPIQR